MAEVAWTAENVIALVGGVLLLAAGHYAVVARRSSGEDRARYRRYAIELVSAFVVFSYAAAVLVEGTAVWPVEVGREILAYFQALDAVPEQVDAELTAFYRALLDRVGVVGGEPAEGPAAVVLEPIRTLGLVVYTVVFSAASLGLHLPGRLVGAVRGTDE